MDSPIKRIWNITPIENTSQISEYYDYLSDRLAISGATKPGVPHFGNI